MRAAYREFRPPPHLAAWVECLWSVDAAVTVPDYGVAPDGCLDIVHSPGGGLRAVGAMTRERRFELPARDRHCGVRFRPGMASAFLRTAAVALTDSDAPLVDLWGAPARALADRLEDALSPEDAAAAFAEVLRPAAPANGVQRAIAAMAAAHGAVDVDEVARQANLSPRQFRRRCLEASGLTPKHLCRVLRFRNAAALAGARAGAEVVHHCRRCRLLRSGAPDPRFSRVYRQAPDGRFFQYGSARRRVRSGHEDHTCSDRGFDRSEFAVLDRPARFLAPASTDGPDLCPLFIEVDDFADVRRRLDGYPIRMPERKTFYGMVEIGVKDPGGHFVVFAARAAEAAR